MCLYTFERVQKLGMWKLLCLKKFEPARKSGCNFRCLVTISWQPVAVVKLQNIICQMWLVNNEIKVLDFGEDSALPSTNVFYLLANPVSHVLNIKVTALIYTCTYKPWGLPEWSIKVLVNLSWYALIDQLRLAFLVGKLERVCACIPKLPRPQQWLQKTPDLLTIAERTHFSLETPKDRPIPTNVPEQQSTSTYTMHLPANSTCSMVQQGVEGKRTTQNTVQ